MNRSSIYPRTFLVSGIFGIAILIKLFAMPHDQRALSSPRHIVILGVACAVSALLMGLVATHFERLRNWWGIGIGTIVAWFVVLATMLLTVEKVYGPPAVPKFKTTEQMMIYFANESAKWVKKDRNINLDYSLASIKIIEEELARISKEFDQANPPQGTFGLAMGYGAYVGEVFRSRSGGSWSQNKQPGKLPSYPLTIKSNSIILPVEWCWKRLIGGEDNNVYAQAMSISNRGNDATNEEKMRHPGESKLRQ